MWAFKTLWDKGLIYEGFRVLAYCWRCETPLSNTETRMDDVYRDRQDPALTVRFRARDRASAILAWTTTPWTLPSNLALAVGPDIDYAVMEEDGAALHPRRVAARRLRARAGRAPTQVGDAQGRRARRPRYTPLFAVLRRHRRTRFQVLAADFVVDRGRHRRRAHGARASARTTRSPATPSASRRSCPMDEHGRFTAEVADWVGHARVRRQPARSSGPQGRGRRRAPRQLRPLVPALLALRAAARLPGDLVVVRRGHPVPRPDGRAQPADHLGARARQGRQLRQVARERPRLVDQPQPLLGLADPGVEERRPRATRGSTCTARSPSSSRLRRRPSPTCTARASTSSCGPTPTTRPGGR